MRSIVHKSEAENRRAVLQGIPIETMSFERHDDPYARLANDRQVVQHRQHGGERGEHNEGGSEQQKDLHQSDAAWRQGNDDENGCSLSPAAARSARIARQ